jgi:hypothetical protein
MPAPSLTEEAKLQNLSLIGHYQKHRGWYIQQAKVLVNNGRAVVSLVTQTTSGTAHTFTQDEIGTLLRVWLEHNPQWQGLLKRKSHLSVTQYDLITDSMARYIAWADYLPVIT